MIYSESTEPTVINSNIGHAVIQYLGVLEIQYSDGGSPYGSHDALGMRQDALTEEEDTPEIKLRH